MSKKSHYHHPVDDATDVMSGYEPKSELVQLKKRF